MPREITEFNRDVYLVIVKFLNDKFKGEEKDFWSKELRDQFNIKYGEEKKYKMPITNALGRLVKSDHLTPVEFKGAMNKYRVLKEINIADIIISEKTIES